MRFEDFQDGHLGVGEGASQISDDSEFLCYSDASHQVWA